MLRVAVVPGSFDPVTLGHVDVIVRTAALFDRVQVLVTHNPGKSALLPTDVRADLVRTALTDAGVAGDVVVDVLTSGLLVDYCLDVGAATIVRGLRSSTDAAHEIPMAHANHDLGGIQTLFLPAGHDTSHISSSLVRQLAALGTDINPHVPRVVAVALQADRSARRTPAST
ncbi:pantetheine-phosphate adenylyltransferase (plasmid) [Rhodococcus antarcticus]|uniref:Phosphopantetheine adenylyltransferase n=1 Tax=Rhodococcus antarcticus TaxID=2987751 RepID=A0ABY6P6Y8_9NOCA|nr:pantetheine-phosphate adenylyltransferase [Rhodococcus antarcticus]UZJ26938.1 pantetheine-phosphate adenylyltransferase [Rhodococcus antarcticus]